MSFENRRVRKFVMGVAGIIGGLLLLQVVANIISGFGYRYFFVNDVLLHWLQVSVGICLISFALSGWSEK